MWKRLRPVILRIWRRSQRAADERRTLEARGRFWAEVRAGQLEAEAASTPRPLLPAVRR
jgi:hypothetical protein